MQAYLSKINIGNYFEPNIVFYGKIVAHLNVSTRKDMSNKQKAINKKHIAKSKKQKSKSNYQKAISKKQLPLRTGFQYGTMAYSVVRKAISELSLHATCTFTSLIKFQFSILCIRGLGIRFVYLILAAENDCKQTRFRAK